jgi:hypothetical protein
MQMARVNAKAGAKRRSPTTLAASTENVVQIVAGDVHFYLREPIDLEVTEEQGFILVAFPPIGIRGYGKTEAQAVESFVDQFRSAWFMIAQESDSRLTAEARLLKRTMLHLVQSVDD